MFKKFLFLSIKFVCSIFISIFLAQASNNNLVDLDLEPLTLSKKISSISIEDAEKYFLLIDSNNKKIDQIKLHKFLYYAQGFFYVFFNSKLIESNDNTLFIAHYYGPYCLETRSRHLGKKEIKLSDDELKQIKTIPDQFSDEQKFVMDLTYNNYKNMSSFEIAEKTHQEAPWKKAYDKPFDKNIEEISIKRFFQSSSAMKDFIVPSIKSIQDISSYKYISRFIKKNLKRFYNNSSFSNLKDAFDEIDNDSWKKLRNILENSKDNDEIKFEIGDISDDINEFKNQLLAHFFFPDSLIELNEPVEIIYQRPSVIRSLSLSAYYNHPLSIYHLYRFCSLHSLDESDDLIEGEKKPEEFLPNILKGKLLKRLQKIIDQKDELIERSKLPYFIKGLFYEGMNNSQKAEEYFLEAQKQGDPRGSYHYIGYQNNQVKELKELYNSLLKNKNYKEAYMGLGALSESNYAFKYFIRAGEAGYPQGYCQAAKMLENNFCPENSNTARDPKIYYRCAGDLGMLSSYSTAAELYRNDNEIQQAQKLYEERAKQLDPIGYYELGEMYKKLNQKEEAIKYYIKSELPEGYFAAASLVEDDKDKKNYQTKGSDIFNKIFEHIQETVFYEEIDRK